MTLDEVLAGIDNLAWNDWVYIQDTNDVSLSSKCLVINPDTAELGSDDFTPLEAEQAKLSEFLSIQDIQAIKANLLLSNPKPSQEEFCSATKFYFDNDSFIGNTKTA